MRYESLQERLLAHRIIDGECWLWDGCKDGCGYGRIMMGSRKDGSRHLDSVHIVAYKEYVGPIPSGLELDHVKSKGCKSRACFRPEHLEPVTHLENVRRGNSPSAIIARTGMCKYGHQLTADNVYTRQNGWQRCKTCVTNRNAEWYSEHREEELAKKRTESYRTKRNAARKVRVQL